MKDTLSTETRAAPRPEGERAAPDNTLRCALCDAGLLAGEAFTRARVCCEPGRKFDMENPCR